MSLRTKGASDTAGDQEDHERTFTQPEQVLELLNDDTTRAILEALQEEPKAARELADICDTSRPTVYRRLDRLESAELVDARTSLHPEGHHRQVFSTCFERVNVVLGQDDLLVIIEDEPSPQANHPLTGGRR